jgi:hypothetical protein
MQTPLRPEFGGTGADSLHTSGGEVSCSQTTCSDGGDVGVGEDMVVSVGGISAVAGGAVLGVGSSFAAGGDWQF